MQYLHWDEKTIQDFSPENIEKMYSEGYLFTRIGKGVMQQTRSVRIDLSRFNLTSENRRILKKNSDLTIETVDMPLSDYDFSIGKLAKDFYDTKFGPGIMSAQKIKELLTSPEKSNFNKLFIYKNSGVIIGYSICFSSKNILHYSYPFYKLDATKDTGLGMMIKALEYAQATGMKYVYLGSLQRPSDTYKLQFQGLKWFDSKVWSNDSDKVKTILSNPEVK